MLLTSFLQHLTQPPAGLTYLAVILPYLRDTVGFIQKLPTQLVAAFQATLEEIASADLLIHVADVTHSNAAAQLTAVQETLDEIGAGDIPTIIALNKIDLLPDPSAAQQSLVESSNAFAISAVTSEGLAAMMHAVETMLFETSNEITVKIPYKEGKLISLFYDHGQVINTINKPEYIIIKGQIPGRLVAAFKPFISKKIENH